MAAKTQKIMIDGKEFEKIAKNYDSYDALREKVIIASRAVLKEAKKLIFALHRGDGSIDVMSEELDSARNELEEIIKKDPELAGEGTYSDAMQEFVEAKSYYSIKKNGRVPSSTELNVNEEYYLLGICDLPGELVRSAVNASIRGDYKYVETIKDFIEEFYEIMLKFNPRNGSLRKKIDSVKWELNKIEDLVLANKKLK